MNVSASSVNARDLYEKKDVGTFTNDICVMVNPNGVFIAIPGELENFIQICDDKSFVCRIFPKLFFISR